MSVDKNKQNTLKMNPYEISEAIKNGIIDRDNILTFDLDSYFQSIIELESEYDIKKREAIEEFKRKQAVRVRDPWENK